MNHPDIEAILIIIIKDILPLDDSLKDATIHDYNDLVHVKSFMRTTVENSISTYLTAFKVIDEDSAGITQEISEVHGPSDIKSQAMMLLLPLVEQCCEAAVALMEIAKISSDPYVRYHTF
jgi:hypothetical protein